MIHTERIHLLNDKPCQQGKYVLYWMQASQRIQCNLALTEAIRKANDMQLPLRVFFHIDSHFPEANYRHFLFLADGIRECMQGVQQLGIRFEISGNSPEECFRKYFAEATLIITDKGYLRIQREWRENLAVQAPCQIIEVEDNLIVPIGSASHKAEWSARTIRRKLMEKLEYFISDAYVAQPELLHRELPDPENERNNEIIIRQTLEEVRQNAWLTPVATQGGEKKAHLLLSDFIRDKLRDYSVNRNVPSLAATSFLSAYLHFGQISPLQIAGEIYLEKEASVFIEQLLVRRELAHNFVWYTPDYDTYGCLPAWCRRTLAAHITDPRPYIYSSEQLEKAETHDPCWNAAMHEMINTGYMENTMRMYWGKKIIEWTPVPEEAHQQMLFLNNRYFLDGRDANSYTGVNWCFGLHDRPWTPRPVFGTVRYMNQAGLLRKYDMDSYIRKFL